MEGTYGSNTARIKRALAYADALRQQGQEPVKAGYLMPGGSGPLGAIPGTYIPESKWDMVSNVLQSAMGGYQAAQAEKEQSELEAKAAKEASDFVLPSMMKTLKKQTVTPGEPVLQQQSTPAQVPNSPFGTTETGPVTPGTALPGAMAQFAPGQDVVTETEEQVAKSIPEYTADLAAAGQSIDPTNPYMNTQREAILKQTMALPQFAFEQQQKHQDALDTLKTNLEAKKEQYRLDYEFKAQTAKDANELRRFALELKQQSDAADAQYRKDSLDLKRELGQGQLDIRRGMLDLQKGKQAAGAAAKAKATPQEAQAAAKKALEIAGVGKVGDKEVDAMSDLIKESTSGGLQTALAGTKEWITGSGTSGQEAIASLATKANSITFDLLNGKLGAGISNADVKFLQSTLGEVADSSKAADVRLAAWRQAKARLQKIANGDFVPAEASAPAGGGYGKRPPGSVVEVSK